MGSTLITISNTITITGELDAVTLNLSGYSGNMFTHYNNVTWSNLKVDNWNVGNAAYGSTANLFGARTSNLSLTFRRMTISNPLTNCRRGYYRGGIFASNYNTGEYSPMTLVLDRCLLYNIQGYGISTDAAFCITAAYVTVTNCTWHFSTATAGNSVAEGIFNTKPTTLIWKNNIVYNGNGTTLTWQGSAGTPTTLSFDYNDSYLLTGTPSGTGNITDDPLFVDPSTGNYDLQPGSPCIDAGTIL